MTRLRFTRLSLLALFLAACAGDHTIGTHDQAKTGKKPVTCGKVECADGLVCCNESCGICAPPDGACIQIACDDDQPPPTCPPVVCTLYCEHGFQKDAEGCDVCACNPPPRTPVSGQCERSTGDACASDADCVSGGCGGELCYNPAASSGVSTCDCVAPQGPGCGCVAGRCTWYK